MSLKVLLAGGAAALALAVSAGAAWAEPGYATATVNVRSGPGTSYGVIDSLAPGEEVNIVRCTGSWCYVNKDGPDGWVSASYLESSAPPPVIIRRPPPVYVEPPPIYEPPPFYDRPYYDRPYYDRPRPRPPGGYFPPPGGGVRPPPGGHFPPPGDGGVRPPPPPPPPPGGGVRPPPPPPPGPPGGGPRPIPPGSRPLPAICATSPTLPVCQGEVQTHNN